MRQSRRFHGVGRRMVKVGIPHPGVSAGRLGFRCPTGRRTPRPVELPGGHPGFASITVVRRMAVASAGTPPGCVAARFRTFDSVDDFLAPFMPHAAEGRGDRSNWPPVPGDIHFIEILARRNGHVDG